MDNQPDKLLALLNDEIERKCFELKQKKAEKRLKQFFMMACALFVIVPFLLVFAGINFLTLCIPFMIFLAVSLGILIPLLFNNNFGGLAK